MTKLNKTGSINSNDEALMQMNASANIAMGERPNVADLSGSDEKGKSKLSSQGDLNGITKIGHGHTMSQHDSLDKQSCNESNYSATQRMMNHMKKAHQKFKEDKEASDKAASYKHEVDLNTVTKFRASYIVSMNDFGKEVFKKRHVQRSRNMKERSEDYAEKRARILSARAKKQSPQVRANLKKYKNMYAKFAENYAGTLDKVVEQSKNAMRNGAKDRQ